MAEARQAVGLNITADGGLSFNFDEDVLHLIWQAAQRAWKKKLARGINNIRTGIFPIRLDIFVAKVAVLIGLHYAGFDATCGIVASFLHAFNISNPAAVSITSGLVASLMLVLLVRWLLRLLFSYQSWMFLSRDCMKSPPITFRVWTAAVKLLSSLQMIGSGSRTASPMLYSYQGALPSLPLPDYKKTLARHLTSMRPILSDKEYEEMTELSSTFEQQIAPRLQRYLRLKWLWSDNYVSDWWEEYVYLRGRSELMINSNYYAIDAIFSHPTRNQAARAANNVHLAFTFRRLQLRQENKPLIIQNMIPMCSRQYDRFFNTCRIPGQGKDTLMHWEDATHVAVMANGKFYRMGCYNKGRLLSPAEMQLQIQGILDDQTPPDTGEQFLAVLTASNRNLWAETRQKYFAKGVNKASLDIIEKAAFVLVLDDSDYYYDPEDDSKLNYFARMMLHGKGYDRWFDKSFCLIFSKNGRMGANAEHSWADAPVMSHFWEYLIVHDLTCLGYDSDGNCRGRTESLQPPKAVKLRWELPEACLDTINTCLKSAKLLVDDLQLHLLIHKDFGKGLIKTFNLSPDAFIQMALQLAYYRDAGRFCLTYEASMTRLFKEGRTETVRSCSSESAAWVRAMQDPSIAPEVKVSLLRAACANHQRLYQEAMTGAGIDRHLFCMYVVAKYLEIESPFLNKVMSEPWRLSTSQTPVRGEFCDVNLRPELISAGGGFGPVADDGYGVSYIITGENVIFFHVSAKHKSKITNATRFAARIKDALGEMKLIHSN